MKTIKHILFIKAQAPIGRWALLFSLLLLLFVKVWGLLSPLTCSKALENQHTPWNPWP